jgi:hypothetical protein
MTLINIFLGAIFLIAQNTTDPQKIVDQCIKAHGGKNYKKDFKFEFRDMSYTYHMRKGQFEYTRQFEKDGHAIADLLTNDGFTRSVDGEKTPLGIKESTAYSNSINSVIYFALLPSFLNDDAVNKSYLGTVNIKGKDYHKIQITFDAEGGGVDHDDVYIYWINKKDKMIDYLAYSFHVNGGGVRFREAYNRRMVSGVVFQDYINYKHDKTTPVADLDKHFSAGTLNELSRIELQNVISY